MTGRAEVHRLRQRVDATLKRAAGLGGDLELLSDHARYLCVLVSGFLERAIIELILEHARRSSGPTTLRYVEHEIRRVTNLKTQRLTELFGRFEPSWQKDLEEYLIDDKRDAVNSVVNLRNAIAHGKETSVTLHRVREYFDRIVLVVEHIADLTC
jgi:hypothetical protein